MGFFFDLSSVVFFLCAEEFGGLKYSLIKFNVLNMFETTLREVVSIFLTLARCEEKILQTRDPVILPECL